LKEHHARFTVPFLVIFGLGLINAICYLLEAIVKKSPLRRLLSHALIPFGV
jgi:hypothetical protein